MNGEPRNSRLPTRIGALAFGLAAVAAAGAVTLDDAGKEWFLRKSSAEREQLREALRRFDMNLNADEQRAARDLDARLEALPEDDREEYFRVLRRYHNWLRQLPERDRNMLAAMPVDARLKRIRELVVANPPPTEAAGAPLDFIQIGGTGAFELAALCKTWLALSPEERKHIDSLGAGVRKSELIKKGRELKIPSPPRSSDSDKVRARFLFELRPADFDEEHWITEAESRIQELNAPGLGPRDWLSKIQAKFEQADANGVENGMRSRMLLRRFAVNLYVEEHKLEHPVDSARLAQFYEAMPSWIRSTFGPFSGDEVRRRLSVLYRILYPFPEEFRTVPAVKPTASVPGAKPAAPDPSPPSKASTPAAPTPKPTGSTPF